MPRGATTAWSGRRPGAGHVVVGAGLLLILIVAVGVAIVGTSPRWALVGGIVLGLAISLGVRRKQSGSLDIVDPIVLFGMTWLAMFALRPVATALVNDWTLRQRYDVNEWIDTALAIALVGEVAYCLAYLVASGRLAGAVLRAPRSFTGSAGGYIVALTTAGIGFLATAMSFGSHIASSSSYIQSLPVLCIPGSMLLVGLTLGRPTFQRLLGYAVVMVALVGFSLIGVRAWILPLLGSIVLLWYFRRGARPRVVTILMIGTLTLIVFSNLEVSRSVIGAGSGIDGIPLQTLQPIAAVERLATGPSSEMLPALALEIGTQGKDWSYSPGYWVTSLVTHWVPSGLWPAKPKSSGELLYSIFFPDAYAVSKGNTQFSVVGEFYFDAGILGVIAGLAGLGLGTALIYAWFRRNEANGWAQISYAMFPWIVVFGLRGDLLQTAALALFLYLPVGLAYGLSPRSAQDSSRPVSGTSAVPGRPRGGRTSAN